tara:strand:- start:11672 stop:11821 length:150 start_codon:yes stop_codon:yes gene_type:complete
MPGKVEKINIENIIEFQEIFKLCKNYKAYTDLLESFKQIINAKLNNEKK